MTFIYTERLNRVRILAEDVSYYSILTTNTILLLNNLSVFSDNDQRSCDIASYSLILEICLVLKEKNRIRKLRYQEEDLLYRCLLQIASINYVK